MSGNSPTTLPPGIPPEAVPFLEEVGYLEPDPLQPGDPAPEVPLYTPEGERFDLARLAGVSPVVLVFGSHT